MRFGIRNTAARLFYFALICGFFAAPARAQQPAVPKSAAQNARGGRTVTIVTEPNAVVWLDNVRYGTTGQDGKFTIKYVSAGRHALRVRADGFKETSQGLPPAQPDEVKIPLTKTTDEAELAYQEAERLTAVDREKSAEAYRRAVRLRPKYPEAYLGLARVLSDSGDLDGALKAVLQARRLRPGYAEASAVEGRILKDGGDEEKAIVAFRRSIAEARGFQPEAHTGLGLLYKERAEGFGAAGDYEQEEAAYQQAVKELKPAVTQLSGSPDGLIVFQLLGLIYEKMKRYPDAIAVYEEFLRLFPDTSEATAVRSFIVQLKKQMSEQ